MKKRFLTAVLLLTLMLTLLHVNAQAAEIIASGECGAEGDNLTWTLDSEGTLTISGTGDMTHYKSHYGHQPHAPWKEYSSKVLHVIVGEGVTRIGQSAFYYCYNLDSVLLPTSMQSVSAYAMDGYCTDTLTVFCKGDMPTLSYEPEYINWHCHVQEGTFSGLDCFFCGDCQKHYLSSGALVTATVTFLDWDGSEISSQEYAYGETVTIPEDPSREQDENIYTFTGWDKAVSPTCTDDAVYTAQYDSLEIAQIIDRGEFGKGLSWLLLKDGSLTVSGTGEMLQYNAVPWEDYRDAITTVIIEEGVSNIANAAFFECFWLKEVTLPGTVSKIGDRAFSGCTALSSIAIPEGLLCIGSHAFSGCSLLKTVSFPDSLTTIDESAFEDCSALVSILLPPNATSIDKSAFSGCIQLSSVSLPANLTRVSDSLFSHCSSLVCVTIPEKVEYIGSNAFYRCTALASVNLPDGLKHIGNSAFYECKSLSAVRIPKQVTYINAGTFYQSRIKAILLPADLSGIGRDAFFWCFSLKHIFYTGTSDQWNSVHKEDFIDAQVHCNVTEEQFQSTYRVYCSDCDRWFLADGTEPVLSDVIRLEGSDRYKTAFLASDMLKQQLGVEKFTTIVIASGTEFADALSGSYLAAVKNAPMLLVRNNKTTMQQVKDYIKANLKSGGTVYLLGGVNAVPKAMETGLEGFTVKRLGGSNRYDTNLLILKEAGVGDKDVLICTGKGFADSLSASAAGLPILLVKDSLTDAQKEFLKGTTGKKYIVGGTTAVNTRIETALKTYGTVTRLGGATRYDTSVLVAKTFFENPTAMVVAYAQNFPDGLSGGPLAYALKAPLILTANGKDAAAAKYAKELGIKDGFVLGGPTLISDKTAKNIFSTDTIK